MLDFCLSHHRITSGSTDAMLESVYEAWATDIGAGHISLLIAASNRDVTALNTRARLERVHRGEVEATGVNLGDGTRGGVGDHVVTRRNDRQLTARDGHQFVKNSDTYNVLRLHRNGDLTARHSQQSHRVRLPHGYCETTSNSAMRRPPHAPKAAPSTPPTSSSRRP